MVAKVRCFFYVTKVKMIQNLTQTIHMRKKSLIFVPGIMYTLKEAWLKMYGSDPLQDWDGKIYCIEADGTLTFRANEIHGYVAAYTFTLVLQGWLTIVYNGHELTLHADDIYIYSPGLPITVVDASDDYRSICLLADESVTIEIPAVHDLVYIAYAPIVELHEPMMSLPQADASCLVSRMRDIIHYLHSENQYSSHIIRMLYAVFILDYQDIQKRVIPHPSVQRRIEDIFLEFIRLLPLHFAEHHDIGFYASQLNISKVYLSRVVRQLMGRTVVDYINQMLIMEASFLLRNSQLSIAQISDRLHFSEPAAFSRFFQRMKGLSPRDFRNS